MCGTCARFVRVVESIDDTGEVKRTGECLLGVWPSPLYETSTCSQYVERVSAVRDELLRRAGRRKLRLPEDLGLPALAPTRDEEILRHLHALDLIERVVSDAIELGVERIDKIEIKLDPGLYSRQGVGLVESTQVRMKLSGASGPMVDLLARSQSADRPALMIDELEILPERNKTQSSRMEVVFLVPYVKPLELDEGEV